MNKNVEKIPPLNSRNEAGVFDITCIKYTWEYFKLISSEKGVTKSFCRCLVLPASYVELSLKLVT